jgi:hypothetical protein
VTGFSAPTGAADWLTPTCPGCTRPPSTTPPSRWRSRASSGWSTRQNACYAQTASHGWPSARSTAERGPVRPLRRGTGPSRRSQLRTWASAGHRSSTAGAIGRGVFAEYGTGVRCGAPPRSARRAGRRRGPRRQTPAPSPVRRATPGSRPGPRPRASSSFCGSCPELHGAAAPSRRLRARSGGNTAFCSRMLRALLVVDPLSARVATAVAPDRTASASTCGRGFGRDRGRARPLVSGARAHAAGRTRGR